MNLKWYLAPLASATIALLSGCGEQGPYTEECTTKTTANVGVNQEGEGQVTAGWERTCVKKRVEPEPNTTPPTSPSTLFGWTGGTLPNGQWLNFDCMFAINCGGTSGYKPTRNSTSDIPEMRLKIQSSEGGVAIGNGQFNVKIISGGNVKQQSFPYYVHENELIPTDKYSLAGWIAANSTGMDGERIEVNTNDIPLSVPASNRTRVISVTAVPTINGIIVDGGAPGTRTVRPRDIGPTPIYHEK